MLGFSHCLSGLTAGLAVGSLVLHEPAAPLAVFTAVTAAYALAPDIDSCGSTVSRSGGFATEAFSWFIAKVSGGHRHGSHSLIGVAVFAGVAWIACLFRHTMPGRIALGVILAVGFASAVDALRVGGHAGNLLACAAAAVMAWTGYGLAVVPIAAGLGAATHLLGDSLTRCGVPLCWPFTMREFHLTPQRLRFTTGHWPEHFVVVPLLFAGLLFLAWRDTGAATMAQHAHLAGYFGR